MNKVKKCLQRFAEKHNYLYLDEDNDNPYKDISYLDIALTENCTEKEFIEILKTKSDNGLVYDQIYRFAEDLYNYEGFKNFNIKTQHQILLKAVLKIERIENYNDIPVKPIIDYWMSHEGEMLTPYFNDNDLEETKHLEFYTKVTNWLLRHNDFKPNLPKSHSIVKWAKRLSKSHAKAYAKQGNLLLEKLGMLEPNKIDTSEMRWMELIEHNLTISCKDLIMTKNNKIHGLVLYFYQYDFTCWCDYKENKILILDNIEDWINGASDEADIDYNLGSIPYDEKNKTLVDMTYLMISVVMAKALINLKNDVTLNTYFSENLKIGINMDNMYQKPIFPGNYHDSRLYSKYDKRYTPDSKIVKKIVKKYISSKENEELIMDLLKEKPTASGLELWSKLTY
ncbi:hypothetical protein [Aquimarina algicola]|uniref:Uncharacterized protein n=1 Tax=Aquimarina algicola TaxID=2589995 RepID=A0A504IWX6_9FLAO|nr:hypothetical protein [Aquimarina algicola]TPN82896.1 hypothetical protein FHK87_20940 [Aquimarina algicola]